jgi:hypothetical protein
MFERGAITTPSCVGPGLRPVCRSSISLLFVGLHDPQHTLAIDWRFSVCFSLQVYEAPAAPIPVGRALVHQPADQRLEHLARHCAQSECVVEFRGMPTAWHRT